MHVDIGSQHSTSVWHMRLVMCSMLLLWLIMACLNSVGLFLAVVSQARGWSFHGCREDKTPSFLKWVSMFLLSSMPVMETYDSWFISHVGHAIANHKPRIEFAYHCYLMLSMPEKSRILGKIPAAWGSFTARGTKTTMTIRESPVRFGCFSMWRIYPNLFGIGRWSWFQPTNMMHH